MDIRRALEDMTDPKNADFLSRLIPDKPRERILGIRSPEIKRLARELSGSRDAEAFMNDLPHFYLEEDLLHAALICLEKDADVCFEMTERFLPRVDNWAVCDSLRPRALNKNRDRLGKAAMSWLDSPLLYTRRFGIGILMSFFLTEGYSPAHAEKIASLDCGEFYLSMMVAWYFATALAKRPEDVKSYFYPGKLDETTRRRAIQKAVDSLRIPEKLKDELKKIRR